MMLRTERPYQRSPLWGSVTIMLSQKNFLQSQELNLEAKEQVVTIASLCKGGGGLPAPTWLRCSHWNNVVCSAEAGQTLTLILLPDMVPIKVTLSAILSKTVLIHKTL